MSIKVDKKWNWVKFRYLSKNNLEKVDMTMAVNNINYWVCKVILEAAENSIQKGGKPYDKNSTMVDK